MNKPLFNNQIKAREVRLISETGEQLGVLSITEALKMAQEKGLDLIQVTEKTVPPVCKIGEYGKYLYNLQKKERKHHIKSSETKTIRLSFAISDNDIIVRTNQAEKFLKKGDKVRIELRLRGRENALFKVAEEKMKKFLEELNKKIETKMEKDIKKENRKLIMIIAKK